MTKVVSNEGKNAIASIPTESSNPGGPTNSDLANAVFGSLETTQKFVSEFQTLNPDLAVERGYVFFDTEGNDD